MLAYLKGTVIGCRQKKLILDVQNVGYEVFVSSNYNAQPGETASFWIYTHVKEDALSLYGFESEKEKEVFVTLIGVSGIGPKSALNILSSISYNDLIQWIEQEDIHSLSQLPKIGKKTAQQMILHLKGKWKDIKIINKDSQNITIQNEITSALIKLGFRSIEIKQALEQVNARQGVKEGIQSALSILQKL